jgi:hypothetical protein
VTTTTQIVVVNPCLNPTIEIGIVINIDFSFNGPSIWNPPPCNVIPPVCQDQIIYICTYIGGPYTGPMDLCTYVSYTNVQIDIEFSTNSGTFTFDTDDTITFLPGVYVFQIEISVGISVTYAEFSITIITHCETPVLTVVFEPVTEYWYTIGSDALVIFSYDISLVVESSLDVNCGLPMLYFHTIDGFYVSIIFTYDIDCTSGINCSISVWTDDVSFSGSFELQFTFYFSGNPSVCITSNIFIVHVINICIPPPGCINIPGCGILPPTVMPPSVTIEIEITVSIDVTIDLPSWNCGTPGCDQQVIIDCTINCDMGGSGVVVIINN